MSTRTINAPYGVKITEDGQLVWLKIKRPPSGRKEPVRFDTEAQATAWMRRRMAWMSGYVIKPIKQ